MKKGPARDAMCRAIGGLASGRRAGTAARALAAARLDVWGWD